MYSDHQRTFIEKENGLDSGGVIAVRAPSMLHVFRFSGTKYPEIIFRVALLACSAAVSIGVVFPFAVMADDVITPYGDYCPGCGFYGTCEQALSPAEAVDVISEYYGQKGYSVGVVVHRGRFIEAEILSNGDLVDKILFDRKTGRLRSIY